MSTVLEVENLAIEIPISAGQLHPVRGISFHVDRGETLAIVRNQFIFQLLALIQGRHSSALNG